MNREMSVEEKTLYGFLVEFESAESLREACAKVRDAGYTKWDAHSPLPLHGMDEAMGIRPTILPYFVLIAGLAGLGGAILLQWWTNAHDYPFMISGKPFFSLPANIPIVFELTVLLSAIAAVVSIFALNGLPQWNHPLFSHERFQRATTDRFFIVVEADDPQFDREKTQTFLNALGGAAVDAVEVR
ncbi:MAG: DUF3341 domain-containing protein [Candidatus Omnitrophota bacterium]